MRLSFGILILLFAGACRPAWGGTVPDPEVSPKAALDSGAASAESSVESARPSPAPQLAASARGAEVPGKSQDAGPVVLSPRSPLFAPLMGDPREPHVGFNSYANERGFQASLGGTLDFLRWKSAPDMEWAWGIFAGLWTLSQNADLSGLEADDWFSGTYLSEKTGPFSFRFEFQDQKSDLGQALFDSEKILLFTRDNFNLTASLQALPGLRLYAGEGLKFPWDDFDRAESQSFFFTGLEVLTKPFAFLGDCRGYGAYHFKYQNQAGETFDHAAQLGLRWGGGPGPSLRLALTYYTGHSEFGQFFQQMDQHWGIGVFYDP